MSTLQTMSEATYGVGNGAADSSDYSRGPFDCISTPRSVGYLDVEVNHARTS
jgi:hypothetical protein